MKPQKPAIAPITTIQTQSAQTLPEIVTAIVEACKLVPDKLQLQIQIIVDSTVVYGGSNIQATNRIIIEGDNSGCVGQIGGDAFVNN